MITAANRIYVKQEYADALNSGFAIAPASSTRCPDSFQSRAASVNEGDPYGLYLVEQPAGLSQLGALR